jgi:3-hydroxy-9,10-secoandrosta-1,3,5(10)-triene-9,17-dione monooxygenase
MILPVTSHCEHAATSASALGIATDLTSLVRETAPETAQLGHLPEHLFETFLDSGLIRSAQPKAFGGTELPLLTQIQIVEELARGCASAAWTIGVYISHNWNLALFSEEAQTDVWGANPSAVACTSAAGGPPPRNVDGGAYFEQGQWRFLSGVHHADWIIVNSAFAFETGAQPELMSFLIPKGQYRIIEDWHTIALAGTGTCSIEVSDVFVPEHRILPFSQQQSGTTPGAQLHDNPQYRVPLDALWPAYLAAPAVGATQGLLEDWTTTTAARRHAYTTEQAANDPHHHTRLGVAYANLDATRLLFHRAVAAAEDSVLDEDAKAMVRVRNRRDYAHVARSCTHIAETIFLASGARSLSISGHLQRQWRDIHGVAQHAMFEYERSTSAWGRRLLGVSTGLDF